MEIYLRGEVSDSKVFESDVASLGERSVIVIARRTYTEHWVSACITDTARHSHSLWYIH